MQCVPRLHLHLLVQFGRHTARRRQQEYKEIGYQSIGKCVVAIASWLKLRRQIAGRQLSRPQKPTRQALYKMKCVFPGVGARGTLCMTGFEPRIRSWIVRSKIHVMLYVQ